jgi:photosystem II stability/assembly factor-like uncharacterized protein
MKKAFILLFVVLLYQNILSQYNFTWKWLYPSPQGNTLNIINIYDINTWYLAGDNGSFIITTNAGVSWTYKQIPDKDINSTSGNNTITCAQLVNKYYGFASSGDQLYSFTDLNANLTLVSSFPASIVKFYFPDPQKGFISTADNLYKTCNGGLESSQIVLPDNGKPISFTVTPLNTLYVLTETSINNSLTYQILKSTDDGTTFTNIYTLGSCKPISVMSISDDSLFAYGNDFIYITTNGGVNWIQFANPLKQNTIKRLYQDKSKIYAEVEKPYKGIFYSIDLGHTWIQFNYPPGIGYSSYDEGLKAAFLGPLMICTGEYGIIYKTRNDSLVQLTSHYYRFEGAPPLTKREDISFNNGTNFPNSYNIWAGNNPGKLVINILNTLFFSSDTGLHWKECVVDDKSDLINDFQMVDSSLGFACGGHQIYKTSDGGLKWNSLTPLPGNNNSNRILFISSETGWVYNQEKVIRTTNGGVSWEQFNFPGIIKLDMLDAETGWSITESGLFYTSDGGYSWKEQPFNYLKNFSDIKFSSSLNGFCASDGIYKTTDAGINWVNINSDPGYKNINTLSNDFLIINDKYNHIKVSYDGGANWTLYPVYMRENILSLSFSQPETGPPWIYLMTYSFGGYNIYYNDSLMNSLFASFAGYSSGGNVYLKINMGPGLHNVSIDLERQCNGRWSFAGHIKGINDNISTFNYVDSSLLNGKYKYRLKTKDINGVAHYYVNNEEYTVNYPEDYSLGQNYPNPFNPDTRIDYTISRPGLVNLKIYNVLGQEIMTLVNEYKSNGSYSVNFHPGNRLTSGVYLYKLQTSGYISTKKLIYLK